MTATVIDPAVTVVEHLDEAWAIPCCARKPYGCGGDNAAMWIGYLVDCCAPPKSAFYCTPCKDRLLTNAGGLYCTGCGTQFLPASTAFKLIEPLNP